MCRQRQRMQTALDASPRCGQSRASPWIEVAMSVARIVLLVVWLLALATVLLPIVHPLANVGRWLFWVLLFAHLIECVLYWPRLRAAPGSRLGHVVNTLLFGIVHVKSLPRP